MRDCEWNNLHTFQEGLHGWEQGKFGEIFKSTEREAMVLKMKHLIKELNVL